MVFGSEDFEHIIGELNIAAAAKLASEGGKKPPELLRFRQRKREVKVGGMIVNVLLLGCLLLKCY